MYEYVSSLILSSEKMYGTKPCYLGYSVRLELTLLCSLNAFQLVMGYFSDGHVSIFLIFIFPLVCSTFHLLLICDKFCFGVVSDFT